MCAHHQNYNPLALLLLLAEEPQAVPLLWQSRDQMALSSLAETQIQLNYWREISTLLYLPPRGHMAPLGVLPEMTPFFPYLPRGQPSHLDILPEMTSLPRLPRAQMALLRDLLEKAPIIRSPGCAASLEDFPEMSSLFRSSPPRAQMTSLSSVSLETILFEARQQYLGDW
jgi:hypothetical protein